MTGSGSRSTQPEMLNRLYSDVVDHRESFTVEVNRAGYPEDSPTNPVRFRRGWGAMMTGLAAVPLMGLVYWRVMGYPVGNDDGQRLRRCDPLPDTGGPLLPSLRRPSGEAKDQAIKRLEQADPADPERNLEAAT